MAIMRAGRGTQFDMDVLDALLELGYDHQLESLIMEAFRSA
ncbi:MAG TPA: hypothetical protein VN611_10190 [Patescibacteria group bacterium]|nr:hypothetical protein [Patescibacteria group bacterium]